MQKLALTLALMLALPLAAQAQEAAKKPAAKATTAAEKPSKAPISRKAAKAVEEATPVGDDTNATLNPAQLAIAKMVHTGTIKCELGASVTVTPDDKKPGFFTVGHGSAKYRVHPIESRTGAIRLEDPRAGVMWLQLGNKSMLMNQKVGQRLADECQAPQQIVFADEMLKNPPKPLFEGADPQGGPVPVLQDAPAPAAGAKSGAKSGAKK